MWATAERLKISREERRVLESLAGSGKTPQKVGFRVQIVLCAAEGRANHYIAQQLGTSRPTVLRWRQRFEQEGVEGLLQDAPRPGRKKRLSRDKERAIVQATLHTKPAQATHWSVRSLAQAQRVSPATVYRVWQKHGLQPYRVKSFKLSTDPEFSKSWKTLWGCT